MRKSSQHDIPLIQQLQTDQMDIHRIKEQQHMVEKIQVTIQQKDQDIAQLKALLAKYQHYQQKYQSLKV